MAAVSRATSLIGDRELQATHPWLAARLYDAGMFVRAYMKENDASHDFSHVTRVVDNAIELANICNKDRKRDGLPLYDLFVVELAAVLHDVGDHKYVDGKGLSKTPVADWCKEHGMSDEDAAKYQTIVDNVSYSHEKKNSQLVLDNIEKYPELAVVQDADRLDALGAVGIARCFTYHGVRNPTVALEEALKHFHEKLLRLPEMMKTKPGKLIATERADLLFRLSDCWDAENFDELYSRKPRTGQELYQTVLN